MAATQYEPPKKIEAIDGIDSSRRVQLDAEVDRVSDSEQALKVRFDAALENTPATRPSSAIVAVAQDPSTTSKPSLIDMARAEGVAKAKKVPTIDELSTQASDLRKSFDKPRAVLMDNAQRFSTVLETDLKSMAGHIEHADKSLSSALSSVRGVEVGSLIEHDKPPMVKFLKFLTDGDHRIGNMLDDISKVTGANAAKMTPQVLLSVQIKLGFVQQELEFFTNVLNKSLESTKTVMNVQI